MEKHYKPYIAVILIQCSYAGLFLLSKEAMSSGMRPSVFAAYRLAFATIALLPFAFFFPSKGCPPLTWSGLCKIFFISSWWACFEFQSKLSWIGVYFCYFWHSCTQSGSCFGLYHGCLFKVVIIINTTQHTLARAHTQTHPHTKEPRLCLDLVSQLIFWHRETKPNIHVIVV
ncbi:hypothetical protein CDL12_27278 [Handroanthus impetiginosus]|uniref:WAT1-related protein n=1 Tax=Handroanthus impetiginosus TaxID=429701 RepID=A0A2G9G4G8_9LAMI|nr:hypothetical protein CDL12_27278 [Handroanthus impetiginosus]